MLPLAIIGANLQSLKQAEGSKTYCSHERVGQGKGRGVLAGMYVNEGKQAERVAAKAVDEKDAYDADRGFNGMAGPQLEPGLTARAAGIYQKMAARWPWAGTSVAAAAGGVLGSGGLLGLGRSMELKRLPIVNPGEQQRLQQHLDSILPRPAGPWPFHSEYVELEWFRARDEAAEQFMKEGGCRSELCLLLTSGRRGQHGGACG